jgi:tRNA threonylcarbamoyladenosine modification (KEOPS) complex  Pcc1 subunit
MKARATARLKFPSERQVKIISEALKLETNKPITSRSRANLEKDGTFLVLKVECRDTIALRAALNAYLRWISAIYNVLSIVDSFALSRE